MRYSLTPTYTPAIVNITTLVTTAIGSGYEKYKATAYTTHRNHLDADYGVENHDESFGKSYIPNRLVHVVIGAVIE